jgi:hypothetical protein
MVLRIPFQYITDLIVSLRRSDQGVGGSGGIKQQPCVVEMREQQVCHFYKALLYPQLIEDTSPFLAL